MRTEGFQAAQHSPGCTSFSLCQQSAQGAASISRQAGVPRSPFTVGQHLIAMSKIFHLDHQLQISHVSTEKGWKD